MRVKGVLIHDEGRSRKDWKTTLVVVTGMITTRSKE